MRALVRAVRGIATVSLTGLGLLVVLRGDGAGTDVLGALLIGWGLAAATAGFLCQIVDGRMGARPVRRHGHG